MKMEIIQQDNGLYKININGEIVCSTIEECITLMRAFNQIGLKGLLTNNINVLEAFYKMKAPKDGVD